MTELKEYWDESIRLNNLGVRYLQQRKLDQAAESFRQASEYCNEASYESSVDGFGVYPSRWVGLSEAFPSIPAYTDSCETVMKPLHPALLSIGEQQIPTGTFVPDMVRRKAVLTSRLDWIIDFNLATSLQLCAFVHSDEWTQSSSPTPPSTTTMDLLQEAFEIFNEMSEDIAEWNNYSASVDIAIFLMMMFQNQRLICNFLGKAQLASQFLMRIRHIQQSMGSITMQLILDGSSCLSGNGVQRVSLPTTGTDHCAPTA